MSEFFMDRSGDIWRTTGRGTGGDAALVCDEPLDPEDRGEDESFPWTVASVTEWFGPLTPAENVRSMRDQSLMEDGYWRRSA